MQAKPHNTKTTARIQLNKEFPILARKINGHTLVYLDSAATSFTPRQVTDAMNKYYHHFNANVHRAAHTLGEEATTAYETTRDVVAKFINATPQEIIFTRGATESLNLLAYTLTQQLHPGDEIVLTQMEHHSNLVPWQQLAQHKQLTLKYILVKEDGTLDMNDARKKITKKTKIVSVVHASNVLGTINDVKTLGTLAHDAGAFMIVDAAQSIAHMRINVQEMDCDFLVFSAHKMYGPTGVGALYGKKQLLDQLPPFNYGGSMIQTVTFEKTTWNDTPYKFEAGTPNIAGVIGLAAAVRFLQKYGQEKIFLHEQKITAYAREQLQKLSGVVIHSVPDAHNLITFTVTGVHSHDVVHTLDNEGIAIRGGHMCVMPLVTQVLKQDSVCRASFALYNTTKDVDKLIAGIKKAQQIFKKDK